MTLFQPDNTVANVKAALAAVITNNVANVTRVYTSEPDGPPEDNSVVIGGVAFRPTDYTSGKMQVVFKFPVRFCRRRRGQGEDLVTVESYFMPFMLAFNSWANQNLDTDTYVTEVENGGVVQIAYAGTPIRALALTVSVKAEFNIPLS